MARNGIILGNINVLFDPEKNPPICIEIDEGVQYVASQELDLYQIQFLAKYLNEALKSVAKNG